MSSMEDVILNNLMGETVVHANPLATVTRNCVIIRDDIRSSQAVIALNSIREIRRVNISHTYLLAISAGLLTIAAAAYASHQGVEVSAISAALGVLFILAYFSTRRAIILCRLDDQTFQSRRGTYREATSIIRAVTRLSKVGRQ